MAFFCTTRSGTLRVVHEGKEYLLDETGLELPDVLAESIRSHVNVVVEPVTHADRVPPKKKAEKVGDVGSE